MELLLESITKIEVGSMLVSVFTDAAGSACNDTEMQRGCVCVCVGVFVPPLTYVQNTVLKLYFQNLTFFE